MTMKQPIAVSAALAAFAAFVSLAGCGKELEIAGDGCRGGILPGDLVISEIMANPAGADEGNEWFEIYNTRSETTDLSGMRLVYSRPDGTRRKEHLVAGLEVPAGGYVAVGDLAEIALPDYLAYGYENSLGSMGNTTGRLALQCKGEIIDEVQYQDAKEGTSHTLLGAPDAMANDLPENWCDGITEFIAGSYGTPGAENDRCTPPVPAGQCFDGETTRMPVAPGPGDLIISEWLANPKAVDDTAGEWFELYITRTVDLNGLDFTKETEEKLGQLSSDLCMTAEAGSYFVFARSLDPTVNGGMPQADASFKFTLPNQSGSLVVSYGGNEIDRVRWDASENGAATAVHPDSLTAEGNDDPRNFCVATTQYGGDDGDFGTPGAANDACTRPPPATQCALPDGTYRDRVDPEAGDLVINELLPDPAAFPDSDAEWLEIAVNRDVDLNLVWLSKQPDAPALNGTVIGGFDCLPAQAGSYILFAQSADPLLNGNIGDVVGDIPFGLTNSGGYVAIGVGDVVLDDITYPDTNPGVSWSLDPDAANPVANDAPEAWCDAIRTFASGDYGTPGQANTPCLSEGECLPDGLDTPRAVQTPGAGDLVITEIFPNPAGTESHREWFEVLATASVDLNWIVITRPDSDNDNQIVSPECLPIEPGDRMLIARNANPEENGGLPTPDALFDFALVNRNGGLTLLAGDITVDEMLYSPEVAEGYSLQLSAGSETAVANDNAANWCLASEASTYGTAGFFGTPGEDNTACGG